MIKKSSITEQITGDLRQEITGGFYHPEAILTEIEISQKYGVSKTPAREALIHLCSEGLLEKIPHKGYFIKKYSLTDLNNLFQFRYILETSAVELAIKHASEADIQQLKDICSKTSIVNEDITAKTYNNHNRKFHVSLAALSKNPFLTAALSSTLDQLRLALSNDLKAANPQTLLSDHSSIIEAISKKDQEAALYLIKNHIQTAQKRIYSNTFFANNSEK